jgi:nucleoid DNA-binding protein
MLSKEDKEVVAAFKEILERELAAEGKLTIRGLGAFSLKTSPARKANSFGKVVDVPEKTVVRFKAAAAARQEA